MANWERKSSYLLREIVKFRTYIDALMAAQAQKDVILATKVNSVKPEEAADSGIPDSNTETIVST